MISGDSSIGFIGAGNMAGALIQGLLANGVRGDRLWASDTDGAKLVPFAAKGVHTTDDNVAVARACDVVVLAVKPQVMETVVSGLRAALSPPNEPKTLVSIAAGIQLRSLLQWSHPRQAIVRCMPNTPALVLAGATGAVANGQVSQVQRQLAGSILEAVGLVCWLEREEQLDAVTALSGSGPAYFFLLMEALQAAGTRLGLPEETARALTLQTALGSAKLAHKSDVDAAELRKRVTSPGGTTEAAIRVLENGGLRQLVDKAVAGAEARARELAAGN